MPPEFTKEDEKKASATPLHSTFFFQPSLPRLPIPNLEETLARFPRALWALQDPASRADTERVSSEFLYDDGPTLQNLLIEYEEEGRATGRLGSYVEEFWSEAYLAPDAAVVLNLNPYFLLEDGPDPKLARDQIGRAASLAFASVKMASVTRGERISPDRFRGRPLCMDQFRALFGSCRVPRLGSKDDVEVDPISAHIVVMCRNCFYYFDVLWPDGTVAVDESDLRSILLAVRDDTMSMDPEKSVQSAVGVSFWRSFRDRTSLSNEV